MSEPFIAEIRIFAGNFAPRGWAFCNGQLLPISQNTALFSLIGTTYGGNGQTTTALPDLEGRAVMHPGQGPGLTPRSLGERGGVETVTLTEAQMPLHQHDLNVSVRGANENDPAGDNQLGGSSGANLYGPPQSMVELNEQAVGPSGQSQAHNNMQPSLAMNFIIALQGLYPSRN
jgi:microcystin-dependent protein